MQNCPHAGWNNSCARHADEWHICTACAFNISPNEIFFSTGMQIDNEYECVNWKNMDLWTWLLSHSRYIYKSNLKMMREFMREMLRFNFVKITNLICCRLTRNLFRNTCAQQEALNSFIPFITKFTNNFTKCQRKNANFW